MNPALRHGSVASNSADRDMVVLVPLVRSVVRAHHVEDSSNLLGIDTHGAH